MPSARRRASPPVAAASGPSTSVVEVTSANSRGLAGPTLTSAVSLPSVARHRPSSLASIVPAPDAGLGRLRASASRVAPDGVVSVTSSTLSAMVWRCTVELAAAARRGAAPLPRDRAASSASATAGAAGRDAARRPRSRAPTARCDRTAAARRGPSPSRDSTSSGLSSGPLHHGGAVCRSRVSTRRNQRLQCGGSSLAAFEAARHRMALAEVGQARRGTAPRSCGRSARPAARRRAACARSLVGLA